MNKRIVTVGFLTLGCLLTLTAAADARMPMTRTQGQKSDGTRTDITVPYLTTGTTAFGAYSVAPRIYQSPNVQDVQNPGIPPVYNLPFYGAIQSFGDKSNGAAPRRP
jgi:hypothetical protein